MSASLNIPGTPPSPPTKRQRAKSFVKRIGKRGSQLFKKHHHDSDPHSSPTISLLIADHARSVLAISRSVSVGGKPSYLRSVSGASDDSKSFLDLKAGEDERLVDEQVVPILSSESIATTEESQWRYGSAMGENTREEIRELPTPSSLLPSPPMASDSESDEHSQNVPSPPPIVVEPEVLDPFLVDDPEDPMSDEGSTHTTSLRSPEQSVAAEEISLAQPSVSPPPSPPPVAKRSVDAPLPPLPTPSPDSEDEEEIPDLYLPALTATTMFLPIPNTDPLTTLLNKYIVSPEKRPARDLSGEWQRSEFHTLVMTNSWRALARMARDRLVAANPEELNVILPMWYLRLSCLARLRLFNQTSAECTNLFSVLNSVEPASARTWLFERLVPFELEVLHTRLKYWSGDHMGYLDALYALMKKCKTKSRQAKSEATISGMWKERGSRICLIIASQFIEMKDFAAATTLLEPLCTQTDDSRSPELRSAVGRIYLQAGLVDHAIGQFAQVSVDPTASESMKEMNAALVASAEGDWTKVTEILRPHVANDPDNFAAINNLSVALLSQGQLKEGIKVLEGALNESPLSVVTAEPLLFNLSTLYELRSAIGMEQKRDLLIQVARQSGDGLRTTCLKMPTN